MDINIFIQWHILRLGRLCLNVFWSSRQLFICCVRCSSFWIRNWLLSRSFHALFIFFASIHVNFNTVHKRWFPGIFWVDNKLLFIQKYASFFWLDQFRPRLCKRRKQGTLRSRKLTRLQVTRLYLFIYLFIYCILFFLEWHKFYEALIFIKKLPE